MPARRVRQVHCPRESTFRDRVRKQGDKDKRNETKGWRRTNVEAYMKASQTPKARLRTKPGALATAMTRPSTAPAAGKQRRADEAADAPADSAIASALARSLEVLGRETGMPKEVWRSRLGFVK